MKLEFKIGDKKLIEPEFGVYYHNERPDVLMIGFKNIKNEQWIEIKNNINNKQFKIQLNETILGLELSDSIYSFNLYSCLNKFLATQNKNYFLVSFCFIEEDGIMREERLKTIRLYKHES